MHHGGYEIAGAVHHKGQEIIEMRRSKQFYATMPPRSPETSAQGAMNLQGIDVVVASNR